MFKSTGLCLFIRVDKQHHTEVRGGSACCVATLICVNVVQDGTRRLSFRKLGAMHHAQRGTPLMETICTDITDKIALQMAQIIPRHRVFPADARWWICGGVGQTGRVITLDVMWDQNKAEERQAQQKHKWCYRFTLHRWKTSHSPLRQIRGERDRKTNESENKEKR